MSEVGLGVWARGTVKPFGPVTDELKVMSKRILVVEDNRALVANLFSYLEARD